MIAYVQGTLASKLPDSVIVEVNGMGISLQTPSSLAARLPAMGETVKLFTHLLWREDGPLLFGFADVAEVELFTRLISVSGIGPKVALSILSHAPPARILTWLVYEDISELRKVPGIGLKTAQRLILELKEKAVTLTKNMASGGIIFSEASNDSAARQALEALMSLGFDSTSASRAIAAIAKENPSASLEQLIAEGLRSMAVL